MVIRNITQFSDVIHQANLSGVTPFCNLIRCFDQYRGICSCNDSNGKTNKYNECNNIYRGIVQNNMPQYINQMKVYLHETKIEFYLDGRELLASY